MFITSKLVSNENFVPRHLTNLEIEQHPRDMYERNVIHIYINKTICNNTTKYKTEHFGGRYYFLLRTESEVFTYADFDCFTKY